MKKIHLDQCTSTQDYLIEKLKEGRDFQLVSTDEQTHGKGRHLNKWIQFKNTLCFSFVCPPNSILTLTSAEMGALICQFFTKKFSNNLFMKWPNDLMNSQGEKCGGIIINNVDGNCVVGVGINLFKEDIELKPDFLYPAGFAFEEKIEYSFADLAQEIAEFILDSRMTASEVESYWEQRCSHKNKTVTISDGEQKTTGKFIGIGKNGEALIQEGLSIKSIYNGHLRINN